jgi:hypothetical protein
METTNYLTDIRPFLSEVEMMQFLDMVKRRHVDFRELLADRFTSEKETDSKKRQNNL